MVRDDGQCMIVLAVVVMYVVRELIVTGWCVCVSDCMA